MSEKMSVPNNFANTWRQTRACARCRRLKMKCAFETPTSKTCNRCTSVGVECSFDDDPTAKYAKKRSSRKLIKFVDSVSPGLSTESVDTSRNGDHISQLQNLVKLVTISLSSLEQDVVATSAIEPKDTSRLNDIGDSLVDINKKLNKILDNTKHNTLKQFQDFQKSPTLNCPYIPFNSNIAREIIEKHHLVSLEEFKIRHAFFLEEMLPYYPIIAFSEKLQNFDFLYENEPLLLCGCVYGTTINDNGLYSKIKEKYYKLTNESLNQMLNYYLESFISYHVYIKSDSFNYKLVELSLILSLWCLPTTTSGHFKNQIHLLIGYNVSLCIDLGDIPKPFINKDTIFPDDSEQRNHLRAFLSVYVSCGSLGLSLPRFKLVTWNKQHHNAVQFLMKEGTVDGIKLPSRNDKYLCYFAQVIRLGQEIFDYFTPSVYVDGPSKKRDAIFNNMLDPSTSSLHHLKFVLDNYEQKIYTLLVESGFMQSLVIEKGTEEPKEKYLLSVIYYQLLMIIYDNIVTKYFLAEAKNKSSEPELESVAYVQYIIKLIKLCESLLNSFIILGQERTINLPTFFFYRPMHSLILLIKLRILINSSKLSQSTKFINPKDLKINAEYYFDGVYKLIHESQHKYSSIVCSRMAIILSRIEKWMHLSNAKQASRPTHGAQLESSNLVNLIDTSKEIENLRAPKDDEISPITEEPQSQSFQHEHQKQLQLNQNQANIQARMSSNAPPETPKVSNLKQNVSGSTTPTNLYANSIQEIFETIDLDLLNYLNPLDASLDFESTDAMFNTNNNVPW